MIIHKYISECGVDAGFEVIDEDRRLGLVIDKITNDSSWFFVEKDDFRDSGYFNNITDLKKFLENLNLFLNNAINE